MAFYLPVPVTYLLCTGPVGSFYHEKCFFSIAISRLLMNRKNKVVGNVTL